LLASPQIVEASAAFNRLVAKEYFSTLLVFDDPVTLVVVVRYKARVGQMGLLRQMNKFPDFALGHASTSSQAKKKPTWPNTLGHSTTSAYSLTDPPARPGYPLFSHPTSLGQKAKFVVAL
jgi:hypothetical protein